MSVQCCLQGDILKKTMVTGSGLLKGKVKTLSEDAGHLQNKMPGMYQPVCTLDS